MDFLCSHIASLVLMKWLLWGLPFVSFVPVYGSFREMTLGKTGITGIRSTAKQELVAPAVHLVAATQRVEWGPQSVLLGHSNILHITPCCSISVGFRDGYHICQIVGEAYEGQSWSQDGESGKVWAVNPTSHWCLGLMEDFLIYPCYKAGYWALVCNMWCMTG